MTRRDEWRAAFEAVVARDADFNTMSGVPVDAVYGPEAGEFLGLYPYTRGPHASMYRSKLWTMRMFAGFGTALDTNPRFLEILAAGGDGLSTAFDLRHFGTGLLGGFGMLLQKLEGAGHAWIELAGELSEYDLVAGQSLRVHPAHIGLVESGVTYELTTVPGIKNKIFGNDGLFLVRLTGPGKVWLQSLSLPMLAHSLQPYIVQPGGGATPSQGLETAAMGGGLAAVAKGLGSLLG